MLFLLCPRVFYYDYKAKRQQRKWDKETSEFPNIARLQWWDSTPPEHWLTAPCSSSPTLGTLSCTMVGPRASWWAIGRDGSLVPFCSWACFLHLAFLLLLSSASLFFSLPLLCTLLWLPVSFYCCCEATSQWFDSLDLAIISHQWWWLGSDCNSSLNRPVSGCGITSLR